MRTLLITFTAIFLSMSFAFRMAMTAVKYDPSLADAYYQLQCYNKFVEYSEFFAMLALLPLGVLIGIAIAKRLNQH